MICQGYGVDNCCLRCYRKGRQLDLRESRSLTQFSQQNLQLVSHRFWAYAYASGLGLMVMMVMVMMVMVMVMMVMVMMVMVMVSKALSPVGWLRRCQSQSINRLIA